MSYHAPAPSFLPITLDSVSPASHSKTVSEGTQGAGVGTDDEGEEKPISKGRWGTPLLQVTLTLKISTCPYTVGTTGWEPGMDLKPMRESKLVNGGGSGKLNCEACKCREMIFIVVEVMSRFTPGQEINSRKLG